MRSQVRLWQRRGVKEGLASLWNVTQVNRNWHVLGVRLLKVPTPKVRILLHVLTDGFANRKVSLTREAFIFVFFFRTKQKQVGRQGFVMGVKVADEPVVVIKSIPMKPW